MTLVGTESRQPGKMLFELIQLLMALPKQPLQRMYWGPLLGHLSGSVLPLNPTQGRALGLPVVGRSSGRGGVVTQQYVQGSGSSFLQHFLPTT